MSYEHASMTKEMDQALQTLRDMDVPDTLRDNLALFLRLVRKVLDEYDPTLCETFDRLLDFTIAANREPADPQQTEQAFHEFHDRQVSLFRYFPITLSQITENLQDTGGRRSTRAEAQEDGKKTSAGGD